MALEDPVVITCAISGALAGQERCPAIPYTPAEYAAEARRAVDEGASMIHIHARRPDGTPSYAVEDFAAITEAIRGAVNDVVINFSTGALGVDLATRIAYLEALEPEVAALNMGSMNYAKYSERRKAFVFDAVFANPFGEIIELLEVMRAHGIRPEHECFDAGHVASLHPLLDMGALEGRPHVDFVMGVTGGIAPTARNVASLALDLPEGAHWAVVGIGRRQWVLMAAALSLGGSVRAGLEDNFHLPDGRMASSNGELIAASRTLVEGVGRRVASVEEARGLLGIRPRPAAARG